jgi:hypothetical protein
VTREWSGLEAAVEEFRKALEPDDFEDALAAVGLSPLLTSLPPVVLASEVAANAPPAPAEAARAAAGSGRARRRNAPVAGESLPAPRTADAGEGGMIQDKLAELLALLKENLALKETAAVEIPRNVTMEIAREVAGRVKDTVLSSLKSAPAAGTGSAGQTPPPAAPPATVEKRIPIGDVAAMIDHLTGGG